MYDTHINQEHKVKCDRCGVKFVGGSELKTHIHKGHNTKCEECNEILGSVGDLDVHKEKFHDSNAKDLTQATCLCGICDPEEFGTKASTEHAKNDALFDGPMLSTR